MFSLFKNGEAFHIHVFVIRGASLATGGGHFSSGRGQQPVLHLQEKGKPQLPQLSQPAPGETT